MDVIYTATFEQLIFTIITAAVLLVTALVLTIMPAKNEDWTKTEDRV